MFHPRNRHQGHYDLEKLKQSHPELGQYVAKNKYGNDSIDFANPEAVLSLNRALLKNYYGLQKWNIPKNYLCPPIPGRADYIHNIADLISGHKSIRVLDIGVGANCIYPIIGYFEYGWKFVGSDINPVSLDSAQSILNANSILKDAVELRLQSSKLNIFRGVMKNDEFFDFTICNPPFHSSPDEAQMGTRRKWKNLGKAPASSTKNEPLNFGGQGAELWCEGGELSFILQMIRESSQFSTQCLWFSTLVSKEQILPKIYGALKAAKVKNWRTIDMSHGQKKSRIIAWTYID